MTQGPHNPGTPIGARPVGEPGRKRPAWLVPLAVLLVLAVIILLLLSQCGGDDDTGAGGTTSPTTTADSGGTAATALAGPSSTGGAGVAAGDAGTVVAAGQILLPLASSGSAASGDGDDVLADSAGEQATGKAVRVQSVPADEGFWLGTSETDRIWVQLTGAAGESPYEVAEGDDVSFTGEVTENATDFAKTAGLTEAEGAAMLTEQGYHVAVPRNALTKTT